MKIMSSSSYNAVTPIHCTVHLRETDISLKGPKYHNLMEERLLQSRLNHLENQLRRTTLVMQRQQAHIQKALNNIPKPSKNLDRRVAEAFRFIMAEELYHLGEKIVPGTTSQTSAVSSNHSSVYRSRDMFSESSFDEMSEPDSNRLLRMVTRPSSSITLPIKADRSRTVVTSYSNRKFDMSNVISDKTERSCDKWQVVKNIIPAIRFQRRVLIMEPSKRPRSSQQNITSGKNLTKWANIVSKAQNTERNVDKRQKQNMWANLATRVEECNRGRVGENSAGSGTKPTKTVEIEKKPVTISADEAPQAWKRITYRRRPSDADAKWKNILGALKKGGQINESLHEYSD